MIEQTDDVFDEKFFRLKDAGPIILKVVFEEGPCFGDSVKMCFIDGVFYDKAVDVVGGHEFEGKAARHIEEGLLLVEVACHFEDGELFLQGVVESVVCEVVVGVADEELSPAFEEAYAFELDIDLGRCRRQGESAILYG